MKNITEKSNELISRKPFLGPFWMNRSFQQNPGHSIFEFLWSSIFMQKPEKY